MQDIAYLHVVINHLPIMGVPIGLGLLLLALWQRDAAVARAALLVLIGMGLVTIAVYLTGKGGEDFIEHLPGRSHEAIEAHEDMATNALGYVLIMAVAAVFAWLRLGGLSALGRRPAPAAPPFQSTMLWIMVLAAAIVSVVLGYTGKLGGRIAHTEFVVPAAAGEGDDEGRHGRGRHRGRD